jgi:hypothetical protein
VKFGGITAKVERVPARCGDEAPQFRSNSDAAGLRDAAIGDMVTLVAGAACLTRRIRLVISR